MAGRNKAKRKEANKAVLVPHPDDAAHVREAFTAADRGDLMSVEESAAYLRELLGDEPSTRK